ncbi:M20 aminoacylase family protein [Nitratireductor sp. ZSWI3]|uniref:M20 aminoacylase family protein n=1 Tax=Nitratireductor sp. ZSWI3 TaxID=2966359 RepID=UPI00215062F5|nr:M20 aminoacylase family protein [Nitratireductor sp. ZSWI3]MCR4268539.1 M20 family metallopeptidase [Nitratireductor sp. ZSWI3]
MPVLPKIADYAEELTAIRRDFHEHPEIGFEEVRTSGIVAELLKKWGVDEVHTGLGKTGVIGVIKGKRDGGRTVGLRADMDALPMDELTNLPYASKNPGAFHGCGHDSHTTMLLGAARYLAETRDFAGCAVMIFQPAEEGLGGARAMLADGLFEKFPCDEIYGMHNNPMADANQFRIKPGPAMAGATFFDITINGIGSHGAQPHHARDPIVIAAALVQALQSVVSRNVQPTEPAVLSVTQIHSGSAYNVVPDKAVLCGTIRYFSDEVRDLVHDRVTKLCAGFAESYEVEIVPDLRPIFDVLMNDADLSEAYRDAAAEIVGADNAAITPELVTGSEDFADMLKVVPGAYCTLGHKGSVPVHNPGFILDDDMLPIGASIMARIVEKRLAG